MLRQLYINNFTIITHLNLEFDTGLTVLTGETGAGKSILVDALSMVLGERFDIDLIRFGTERCEIRASFDVSSNTKATQWLEENALREEDECILTRMITREGRSKNMINGRPCTLLQLRELGELLVHIHSQHQHYALLKPNYPLELLDAFAQNATLNFQVQTAYRQWQEAIKLFENAQKTLQEANSQIELWRFQLNELDKLNLKPREIAELTQEHKQLSNAEQLIHHCQSAYHVLDGNEQMSVLTQLHAAHNQIKNLVDVDKHFQNIAELIQLATLHTQESATELRHFLENFNLDPERLQWIDLRLNTIYNIARKYRIKPEELYLLHETLQTKLSASENSDEYLASLERDISRLKEEYLVCAKNLSAKRKAAAKIIEKNVNHDIKQLGIPNGQFKIELMELEHPGVFGLERCDYLISANPGQPLQTLNKVVSGGELARIALAIQVATAQTKTVPTLIFDEVDVGIGGATAEIVGRLLNTLAENFQILCITHLPQVASQGQQHLKVMKEMDKDSTSTKISLLSSEEKIQEIARMLGGIQITKTTLEHAKEMIKSKKVLKI